MSLLIGHPTLETIASHSPVAVPVFDRKWYIVQCFGKSDNQALNILETMGLTTYYPKILDLRKVPRNKLSRAQRSTDVEIKRPHVIPLFPRYLFAWFDITRDSWRDIFKIAGVGGLVCKNDMPVYMPQEQIDKFKNRENNGIIPGSATVRLTFGIGDHVNVTAGPFASFPGIVEKGLDMAIGDLDPTARIKVAVNIFGRATPVELELWQVAKA
jgi:transcriptional antiterminator NusG